MMKNEDKKPDMEKFNGRTSLEELMPVIEERLAAGQSIKFSPRGTSMLPMIRQGKDQVVISSPPKKLKKFDIALYRRQDGSFVLHRIVKVGETYTCIGDNQFSFEKGIEHSRVIAVVTSFVKNGKLHSVNEPGYKTYCFWWHALRPMRRIYRSLRYRLGRLKRRIRSVFKR